MIYKYSQFLYIIYLTEIHIYTQKSIKRTVKSGLVNVCVVLWSLWYTGVVLHGILEIDAEEQYLLFDLFEAFD